MAEAKEMSEGTEPTDAQMAEELMELSGETHEPDPAAAGQPETGEKKTETQAEQLYEVNGEKLTLEQLQKGYMRQQDYTKKTQEAADMRREAEAMHQKRLLDEMFSFREAPGRAEAEAHLAAQGDLTPDEVSLLDPVSKKAYDVAVEARSRVEAMENRTIQREKYEQGQAMLETLNKFQEILIKQHGMSAEDAEEMTGQVGLKRREMEAKGGYRIPYNVEGFATVLKTMRDVPAEAERLAKQKFDEYLAQKASDATAALAGGTTAAFDPGEQRINPWKLLQEDPEAFDRAVADSL